MHPFSKRQRRTLIACGLLGLLGASSAQAEKLRITVENLSPPGGTFLTPTWVGFHDGSFDLYDIGAAASSELERLAEDGAVDPLSMLFQGAVPGGVDATLADPGGLTGPPVIDPGRIATGIVDVQPADARYFSYASMVIPSNDAFIANGDAAAVEVFDTNGDFVGPISFLVVGSDVLDAGTEVNTETDAAFLNQMDPDTGMDQGGVVSMHPGFNGSVGNPGGTPMNILGGSNPLGVSFDAEAADFTRPGAQVARITIASAQTDVHVSVENLRPEGGTFLTPVWVGFHGGEFDLYDLAEPATTALERIAEDGSVDPLRNEFELLAPMGVDAVLTDPAGFEPAPIIDPGHIARGTVALDPEIHRFMSYATMVIPSNDAFIGNDDPESLEVFDADGNFLGRTELIISGELVRDAGTEVNNEMDAAFLNQSAPDTGEDQGGAVSMHPGFNGSFGNPGGTPVNILGGENGAGVMFDVGAADFTRPGSQLARIVVSRPVDSSFSGHWYEPERSGEGLQINLSQSANGQPIGVMSWYTYAADGSDGQAWLVGSGPLIGTTLIVDLYITGGTGFGSDFDAGSVETQRWGQARIDFSDCSTAQLSYDSTEADFGSGTLNLMRLSAAPMDSEGICR